MLRIRREEPAPGSPMQSSQRLARMAPCDGCGRSKVVSVMKLVGVDGCRAGWVVASSEVADAGTPSLSDLSFSVERSFRGLLDSLQGQRALVAVDIPIGLPSGAPLDGGRRRADAEARTFLGPRRAPSVFSAPCRATLAAKSYREACDLEVQARGAVKGLSQQAYHIIPKIREIDTVVRPADQEPIDGSVRVWIREVHPEVTFARLAPEQRGLDHPKRGCKVCRTNRCTDFDRRLDLLRTYVPSFDPTAERQRLLRAFRERAASPDVPTLKGIPLGRDDVVDAVACLVTALRIVAGDALTLPAGEPAYDARGLRMEIVA